MSGLPGYWVNETSGVLKPVVVAYLEGEELSRTQVHTMRAYLRQWINADLFSDVTDLRDRVDGLETTDDIRRWMEDALERNVDPL